MIHAREDYNRIQDPDNKIPEDEPVFLLRGQDPIAPTLLLDWSNRVRAIGGDPHIADLARLQARRMIEWQKENGFKIPDLPRDYNEKFDT